MAENEKSEVVVTNGHIASVMRALQRDIHGLTPEALGEDAVFKAATVLAHIDELDSICPYSVEMMLAIVHDNYDPQIRRWAKATYDFVDGEELRRANTQLEMAMFGVRNRYESWELWKRRADVQPSVAA